MIARIWHGWTSQANADKYETVLKEQIFAGIRGRQIPGFRETELLRRDAGNEVEFITILKFDSLSAVRAFAGEDYELAVIAEVGRPLLERFDERSQHYEVIVGNTEDRR